MSIITEFILAVHYDLAYFGKIAFSITEITKIAIEIYDSENPKLI